MLATLDVHRGLPPAQGSGPTRPTRSTRSPQSLDRIGRRVVALLQRDGFVQAVEAMPEVVGLWRLAGEADYLLKVVATDMAAFDASCQHLAAAVEIRAVPSQLATERVACTTALPVPPSAT